MLTGIGKGEYQVHLAEPVIQAVFQAVEGEKPTRSVSVGTCSWQSTMGIFSISARRSAARPVSAIIQRSWCSRRQGSSAASTSIRVN